MSKRVKVKSVSTVWDELKVVLDDIMHQKAVPPAKWMSIYTDVYNLCMITPRRKEFQGPAGKDPARQPANELYGKMGEYLRKSVKSMELLMEAVEDPDQLVRTYVQEWNKFSQCAQHIDHLLDYMNRFWVPKMRETGHKEVSSIQTLVLLAWRDYVFNALCRRITDQLLQLIERERDGDTIDTSIISTVAGCYIALGAKASGSLVDLTLYNNEFARPYESNTRRYYTHEAAEQLSILGVSKYLALVDKRLEEERKRSEDYLHSSTRQAVRDILMDTLVRTHKEALCAEFPQMLEQNRTDDLALLYKFINEVSSDGVAALAPVLGQYILEVGHKSLLTIHPPAVDPIQFIRLLLDVYIRFDELVTTRCKNDSKLRQVFIDSCKNLVNSNNVTKFDKKLTPESMAKFADQLLKKGGTLKQSMEETERDVNALIGIYSLLDDKDVFQTVHGTLLAKRLVTKMSVSTDLERTLVERIGKISGQESVMKMTRMLKDEAASVDIAEEFHKSGHYPGESKGLFKKAKSGPSCDFQPMILTKGSWPLQPYDNFKLPADLMVYESAFMAFFKEKNPRQKLKWAYNMSRGELIASCFTPPAGQPPNCVYTLLASSHQVVLLMLFNDVEQISLKDITEKTGIDTDHAKSVLLLFTRHKILKCSTPPTAITPASVFSVNRAFSSKRLKLNLTGSPNAANKAAAAKKAAAGQKPQGTPAENEGNASSTPSTTTTTTTTTTPTPTPGGVDEDGFVSGMSEEEMRENRKYIVQSVIVRIMKARKTITHTALISETINQVSSRFTPNVPMIKACIEGLIEQQFLTRDMKNPDTYHYIA